MEEVDKLEKVVDENANSDVLQSKIKKNEENE